MRLKPATVALPVAVPLVLMMSAALVAGRAAQPAQRNSQPGAPPAGATGSGIPRTKAGHPDFTGIWQSINTANWDLLPHAARRGPLPQLGAGFSVPGGTGIVEGDEIPYLPAAAAKKKDNGEHWMERDPELKCYMPGVPRVIYMPYPIQIIQGADTIFETSEFASASRTIRMNSKEKSPTDTWMGWSIGHWEADTLIVEVTDQIDQTWLSRAGDFHSEKLHVTERYTLADKNTIRYEATMTDPDVYSRRWTISLPLYRRLETNSRLMEYKCVEFAEEMMYGNLRKKP
jgi:hypothetical protein